MSYEVVLSLHVISVISWMAGMLYLPRIFVYHSDVKVGSEPSELFKIMEAKLLKYIMLPAMISSWVFGLWLAIVFIGFKGGWLHTKLLLVVLLSACHGYLKVQSKKFANDMRPHTGVFYRYLNEAPTVLMIAIVFLVFLKPF